MALVHLRCASSAHYTTTWATFEHDDGAHVRSTHNNEGSIRCVFFSFFVLSFFFFAVICIRIPMNFSWKNTFLHRRPSKRVTPAVMWRHTAAGSGRVIERWSGLNVYSCWRCGEADEAGEAFEYLAETRLSISRRYYTRSYLLNGRILPYVMHRAYSSCLRYDELVLQIHFWSSWLSYMALRSILRAKTYIKHSAIQSFRSDS